MPRSRRPPTSQSSRPSTAADDYAFSRPGTASSSSSPYFTSDNPQPLPIALHAHYAAQYQYPDDPDTLDGVTEEDEDEESDAEDVFAYLPPTTADQERDQQQSHLQPPPPARIAPPADSPPDTVSSYEAFSQGTEALHLRPVTAQSHSQNDASPPYTQSRNPLQLNTSTAGVRQLHVALPSPTQASAAGPSQPSYFSGNMLPGSAYDNPYQFTLSQMSASSLPPSTPGSTLAGSDGLRHRHNINVGVIKRHKKRRGKVVDRKSTDVDEPDLKEVNTTVGGSSIAKLVGSEISSLEYTRRPRRIDEGALDELDDGGAWDRREGSIKMEYDLDAIENEDSPYPEVRASVSNVDDPEMPALTLRMWVIGLCLCVLASAMNVFFNFRNPGPTVIPLVLLLLSYPAGKLAAYALPIVTYRFPLPARLGGPLELSLNPGPWNIKEHVLVFIMSNVAITSPFALNAIVVGEVYYDIKLGFWFNLTLILATQLTGFGLAGLCRQLLVYPASMVWPQNLVACTLLNTLHAEDDEGQGGITRYRFFMWGVGGAFAFFFLPGFLFTALSAFSWVCWIKPNNIVVNQLFGVTSGMGMGILTFDWTEIAWIGSPLMVPWWAEVHIFIGFVIFFWIITPLLYYTNVWNLAYFPMAESLPYDRFGNQYNVSQVLTADNRFNETAYALYSPLYLPATYAVTYVLALALFTCVIVHTLLYHGESLFNGFKRLKVEADDIHAKLMHHYPEVPALWYLSVFIVFFCMAIIAVEVWHTNVPVWALLLALILPIIYVLPSGFIYAMTGQPITLNLPAQILPGMLLPGNPLANMVFKSYSVQTLNEAINFTQDLKLGHYIKVPPRATFMVQAVATIIAAFVQVSVKEWMFNNIPDMCTPNQRSSLTCPHNQVFFTASAIWGLIGPQRQFGKNSIYHPQLYALIIGAFLPVPFWLWQRRFPKTRLKFINMPVMLNGVQFIPPATGINYSSWFAVAFVFQYLIRRRSFPWWSKFNYVTSAALDCGTTLSLLFIFFTIQFPKGGSIALNWWGNDVYKNTADFKRLALRQVPMGGL